MKGEIKMKHPFLIDINDKENWLYPTNGYNPDGSISEEQRTITMPEGLNRMYCFTASLMHPSKNQNPDFVGMHEHHMGYETFFVESGSMILYINGKKTIVEKGDIIHMQPYEAHGMLFRDYTLYRGTFHDWNCTDDAAATALLEKQYPDAKKDPKFFGLLISNIDMYMREPADYPEVPASEVPAVRNPDRPLAEYRLDGVTMKMITGRWENGGKKELWRAEMKKGFFAEWQDYPTVQDLFYVQSGSIEFKVYDEVFTAGPDCLVKIPKYAPHSLIVKSDSVMYDTGGLTQWYALLGDRDSILKLDPERMKKPETMEALKAKYGCLIKTCGMK
jgi:quercetin dioxygenase-like cupin family protein